MQACVPAATLSVHTGVRACCHAECSGPGSEVAAACRSSGLSLQFVRCAYIIIVMAVYWCTEVIPLAVTALLPALLFPLFKILDSKQVSAPEHLSLQLIL